MIDHRFKSFVLAFDGIFGGLVVLAFLSTMACAQESMISLPKEMPFPESVTSAADGTLYVSSISNGGIARAEPGLSHAKVWIKPGAFDTRSTLGVLADEAKGILWVCSNDASSLGLPGPSEIEGSYVKGFDLKSGVLKASIPLPAKPAFCNDFTLGKDGSLYVTNTAGPQIFRLAPGANQLELWFTDDTLKGGLDGIAFGEDGNLYVNTFNSGEFFRVNIRNGAPQSVTKLETSRSLSYPDALRAVKGGFLMVEGAGTLDQVTVSGNHAKVQDVQSFAGPTSVTLVKNKAWISEGQLDHLKSLATKEALPSFQLRSINWPQ